MPSTCNGLEYHHHPFQLLFFLPFIVQLLCVCFVIDVFAVEPVYWWKILVRIELSRYCYASYCWRPNNSVTCLKWQRFPLVTERLSIPFSVGTLAIMTEVLHGFTHPVHAVVWIVSQTLPRSVLLHPVQLLLTTLPFHSTPIFRSCGSVLHCAVYRDKTVALRLSVSTTASLC